MNSGKQEDEQKNRGEKKSHNRAVEENHCH